MLKRVFLILLLIYTVADAEPFSKMATVKPVLVQKGAKKMWCSVCGMNLKMFYKTSYIAGDKQYCSIRCLVADMESNKIDLNSIEVIDVNSQKPILAKDAYFVIGSDIKGTMSSVSKLAFKSKDEAIKFIKEHGGKLAQFQDALKEAQKSLDSDSSMVKAKKEKKLYPMGKKIFTKKCKGSPNLDKFSAVNELKVAIKDNNICQNINEKQLHAVAIYLWDNREIKNNSYDINISKKDKCPICGMFVYKYPKWITQIVYRDKNRLSFDGVKDMMKFYFDRTKYGKYETLTKDNISQILVRDYYSQKVIDGKSAYFVIGSDIKGPMGDELIPFKDKISAKSFLKDHNGKKIVKFNKISIEDLK